jgi:hypothetical protein
MTIDAETMTSPSHVPTRNTPGIAVLALDAEAFHSALSRVKHAACKQDTRFYLMGVSLAHVNERSN